MSLVPSQHSIKRALRSRNLWHWLLLAAGLLLLIRLLRPPPSSPTRHEFKPMHVSPPPSELSPSDGIDWTRFAYVQYVTDTEYLCNSLMIFESLHRLGSKADRVLLYPNIWELYPKRENWQSRLLRVARDRFKVHIVPVRVQHFESGEGTWADSFTKLLAFRQVQYDRVLSLDSDATILRPLDDLFFLPNHTLAAPHAYWLPENDTLSTAILLIQPSMAEYKRVLESMYKRPSSDFYDMEVINDVYAKEAMILDNSHWVVSGEFRRRSHKGYLAQGVRWDAKRILNETKLVHFSDWPRPKPWLPVTEEVYWQTRPKCETMPGSSHRDCSDRDAWLWLYDDFARRRGDVCGSTFMRF